MVSFIGIKDQSHDPWYLKERNHKIGAIGINVTKSVILKKNLGKCRNVFTYLFISSKESGQIGLVAHLAGPGCVWPISK